MVYETTSRLCDELFERIDWAALGAIYCDDGGEAFWDEHRGPALVLGVTWADALGRRVARGGRSLYVGAGVAELVPMLHEAIDLQRRVVATNRRDDECEVLNAALAAVGVAADVLRIEPVDARARLQAGPFDHVSVVSVLSDPETWPTVGAVTYGRMPPVLLDVGAFVRERDQIVDIVDGIGASLASQAVLTTTVEEVPWFLAWADRVQAHIEADDEVVESALVGDPIGFLEIELHDG
ncbi:MAG: hypothetical protein IPM29_29790 [Planctomycetes bacterium]|nr:hypothetical protein [Planctomycetota bacterium]